MYADKYVSKRFVAFAETVAMPLGAGAWAGAWAWAAGYRFVRAETGEETAIAALGVITVGA